MAKFQVQGNDEIILVEFESESGLQNVSYGPSQFLEKSIEDSRKAIDRAMDTMRGMAKRTMASIKDIPLAERPTTISVSFGLKLDAEAGAVVAKAGTEASINVTMTWSNTDKES